MRLPQVLRLLGNGMAPLELRVTASSACRLCERQTRSGGLNGRPEKVQDVCYSWWCLSALSILGRLHWIDGAALSRFILFCQARLCLQWHTAAACGALGHGFLACLYFQHMLAMQGSCDHLDCLHSSAWASSSCRTLLHLRVALATL